MAKEEAMISQRQKIINKIMSHKLIIIIFAAIVLLITIVGIWHYNVYKVSKLFDEKTIELGDDTAVSGEKSDYLEGSDKALAKVTLDTSKVDVMHVGDYEVTCDYKKKTYNFIIHVVDTTAPVIKTKDLDCKATKARYKIAEFVSDVSDISGEVEIYFIVDGKPADYVSFDEPGEYEVLVNAKDASGNVGEKAIQVKFDEPPRLEFVSDRVVRTSSHFLLTDYVAAIDNEEGYITDRIVITSDGFDIDEDGSYLVTYEVTDQNGLSTKKNIHITVSSDQDVSDTYYNVDVKELDDNGYFEYNPLASESLDDALKLTMKSAVDITSKRGYGSALIYDITPRYIYFVTAKHCSILFKNDMDIMFYNGCMVTVDDIPYVKCKDADVAMFIIPTEIVPQPTLLLLKESYVDKDIYSKLKVGDNVYACTMNWKGGVKDINKTMEVLDINATTYDGWDETKSSLLVTENVTVGGQSGSGVYDLKGNLVGVVSGARRRVNGSIGHWYGVQVPIDYINELLDQKGELIKQ